MVVAPVSDSFVESRVVFHRHPSHACQVDFSTLEQLAFLNLQMNNSVLLIEAETGNHPEMEIWKSMNSDDQLDSHVVSDVRQSWTKIEESIGFLSLLVTNAEAVTAVPEQITPPRVNLKRQIR